MTHMTKPTPQPDAKLPRTTAPASLLSQWWTLGTITADRRTTGRHAKVAWVIIDRYRQDFGNGRASVRYIARACDLSASIVSKACRELVDWGFFSQNIGVGTRPTEFTPNWATVPPVSNAKAVNISVLQGSNACVPQDSNASADSVLPVSNESYLLKPADRTGLQLVGNEFEAAPRAPLADGPEAAAAVPASGGFEEFWSIWPRKHGKAAARVAFAKVAGELHGTILHAARAWAGHYAKHTVDKKWIPEPANWLTKERWDEDLPIIHDDSKGAAIAKAKANSPGKSSVGLNPGAMAGEISPFSDFGTFDAKIVKATITHPGAGEEILRLELKWGDFDGTWHEFATESEDPHRQQRGRAMLASIGRAIGMAVEDITDTEQLLFKPFRCTTGMVKDAIVISYEPLPANDNDALESAA